MYCRKCKIEFSDEAHFCHNCGSLAVIKKNRFSQFNFKKLLFFFLVAVVLITFVLLLKSESFNNEKYSAVNKNNSLVLLERYFDDNLKKSVVNIICSDKNDVYFENDATGGTGTMLSPTGVVLTNFHIIPYKNDSDLENVRCMVILSEPRLGSAAEAYVAKPMVYYDLSLKYDLVFLEIVANYVDEDGFTYGDYEKDFAFYDNSACVGKGDPLLGEKIRIFGFPAVSGGSSLTITDGLISSFDDNEDIITSAKIDSGNSGGLAVDENGCIVGIPSAVSVGDYESLGLIISVNNLNKFLADFKERNESEKTFNVSFGE